MHDDVISIAEGGQQYHSAIKMMSSCALDMPPMTIRECMRVLNMHYVLQEQASRKLGRIDSNITSRRHESGSSLARLARDQADLCGYSGNSCHISLVPRPPLVLTFHFAFNIVSAI